MLVYSCLTWVATFLEKFCHCHPQFVDEKTGSERQSTLVQHHSASRRWIWTWSQVCLLSLRCLSSFTICAPEGCEFPLFIFTSSMPNVVCDSWWTSHTLWVKDVIHFPTSQKITKSCNINLCKIDTKASSMKFTGQAQNLPVF